MNLPRRDFLKSGGALIIGFSLRESLLGQSHLDANSRPPIPGPPDAKQIDTWLAIHADNTATIFIGFAELGQGNSTALLQVAAEELDLDMSQLKTVRLDTSITPNQGGTYSSASIQRGGPQVRTAAAEARQALLQMASKNLNAPIDRLTVAKGVVSVNNNSAQSITYGALVGDKPFHLAFTGTAPVKTPAEFKVVGKRVVRNDIPDKVSGKYVYMQHVRVSEMLHGRVVRPRGQSAYGVGAKVLSVDEASIRNIPGARLIHKGDFIGVVAENEWDAVRAAAKLKVTWDMTPSLPGSAGLFESMRNAKSTDRVVVERGDIGIFGNAPHVVAKTAYHGPYQAHAPFGPNCALADVTADSAVVKCSTQDVYGTRNKLSAMLGMPPEKVRVQYYEGSGTYGHSCYDDVALASAILSQGAGKPVRLQFMRWDEHGWDNYGPAHVGEVRAAADAAGKIVAYEYHGWQHSWTLLETSEQLAYNKPGAEWPGSGAQGVNANALGGMYKIPNVRIVNHQISGAGYLKGGWLRSPLDLSFAFASEQAIDQLAYMLKMDPYEFRKSNIVDERWMGVLDAAAKAANWRPRRAAPARSAKVVRGHGIGLGTHLASYGGAVAEIEINKENGKIAIKHLYGAIDAGLVVNPAFVENQISGQLVQTASRMLKEEVTLSTTNVTSLDWNSYPILRFEECPEVTPVVVQRLDRKSSGAGEEVMAAAAAAIGNAFFDATGVRMREYPLTPARVLTALKQN
ncbi:MAG TPA: molybdopterin cofactor-binding domain-containing protein [Bryobacteraceae bacterium]|jgi:CO/xanthine dehydrogenase Mo-binding subunit|nr:molybdopterin cofactor-binding domain-containing protein [Bryobacteraceae bacterium]